jgi:GH43 family beta-xylosidase
MINGSYHVRSIKLITGKRGIVMKNTADNNTYLNPILDQGADPWMIKTGGSYYLCGSEGDRRIYLTKASSPWTLREGERHLIYEAPEGTDHSHEIWAPELHYVKGRWYVYYAADDGENRNHRMFVLQGGTQEDNPLLGDYRFLGKITDETDRWAIDGTVLNWKDQLYFLWSGWEADMNIMQNIYIAEMANPWTIKGPRVCISTPDRDWEKKIAAEDESWVEKGIPFVNEGPEVLIKGNTVNIIYSASGSWTDDYCLGRLYCNNEDFLNPSAWFKEGPVFSKTDQVFGPGHASFVKSPDEQQDYIIYHAAVHKGSGWDRNIRMQSFTWKENCPMFGEPQA